MFPLGCFGWSGVRGRPPGSDLEKVQRYPALNETNLLTPENMAKRQVLSGQLRKP